MKIPTPTSTLDRSKVGHSVGTLCYQCYANLTNLFLVKGITRIVLVYIGSRRGEGGRRGGGVKDRKWGARWAMVGKLLKIRSANIPTWRLGILICL